MKNRSSKQGEYASPACYAHELDELYRDLEVPDADTRCDVMRWRKAERERLLALRDTLDDAQREAARERVIRQLDHLLQSQDIKLLGVYWPIHREIDLRAWMCRQADSGLILALPVVRGTHQPLQYSRWRPRQPMRRGHWGIAEPADDDWVTPQMMLAPLVGVDRQRYRLGYGGGFFDRSLAGADPRPRAVGVGYDCARVATIYPQPHDVPMDFVVTG